MVDFGTFPFTSAQKIVIETSVKNYWRMARIQVDIKPGNDTLGVYALLVEISQKELVNDRILTYDELVERATKIFEGVTPKGQAIRITAKTYGS